MQALQHEKVERQERLQLMLDEAVRERRRAEEHAKKVEDESAAKERKMTQTLEEMQLKAQKIPQLEELCRTLDGETKKLRQERDEAVRVAEANQQGIERLDAGRKTTLDCRLCIAYFFIVQS